MSIQAVVHHEHQNIYYGPFHDKRGARVWTDALKITVICPESGQVDGSIMLMDDVPRGVTIVCPSAYHPKNDELKCPTLVLVIGYNEDLSSVAREEITEEQPNDSYRKVYLKPDDYDKEARKWLATKGIKWREKNDYEYVLFEICW